MKGKFTSYVLLLLFFFGGLSQVRADRGDLVSYEEMRHFESSDVVDFMAGVFDGYINPEENPELFAFATAFFGQLINERTITVYKMVYETVDFDDQPAIASGIILIPDHAEYSCTKSFSLYAHGTVFARERVNSRINNWGGEFMLTLMMASINTICVAPDYFGLGDGDGFHHHSHYKTNGTSSLDAVRAGRELCDILGVPYNNRLMPMGYSEGGHASMTIGKMIYEENLQNEFKIPFIGAGSGAYDMSGEAFNFILGNPYYPTRQYILYQLASCEDMYGDLILEEEGETYGTYLRSPYDELTVEHVLGQTGNMGWVPSYWPDMFQPNVVEDMLADEQHPFRVCLERSDVFDWYNTTPTFMYYCTTDEQVPYTAAIKTKDVQRSLLPWYMFWQRFKIQALDLTLGNTIPDHGTCALPSIFVQIIIMGQNLGLSCEYTGRTVQTDALRTPTGELLNGRIIYNDKTLNLTEITARRADIKTIEGVNLQTGREFSSKEDGAVTISENGLYLMRIGNADGTESYTWFYKSAPDYVTTEDYNPVTGYPEKGYSIVDLSLLQEDVLAVSVADQDGVEWYRISDVESDKVRIDWPQEIGTGQHMVVVETAKGNYPLLMETQEKQTFTAGVSVFPNPVGSLATIALGDCSGTKGAVNIFNATGALVKSTSAGIENCRLSIDTESLVPGMYHVEVQFADGKVIRSEFVK